MALTANNKGGVEFKMLPQGTHMAVCNMIIDLGNQEVEWQGNIKIQHKCYIRWEIPSERIEWQDKEGVDHEGPMTIGKSYTVGLGDKYTMKTDFEAWRGKAFSQEELDRFVIKNVLGVCCQINVSHKTNSQGKEYARVEGLAGWPKGITRIKTEAELIYFDDEEGDVTKLPQWAQDAIGKQVEAPPPMTENPAPQGEDFDDDIPF